jgi:hypothetical protein
MLDSLGVRTSGELTESSPAARPAPRARPLAHPWQIKWIDMERTCEGIQQLADAAHGFCKAWMSQTPTGFRVIVSDVGRGKTHVSRRIANWARLAAYSRWARNKVGGELPRVAVAVGRLLSPDDTSDSDWKLDLEDMSAASMVILDDIGSETDRFKTLIPASRLCQLLNRVEGKYVWITTNKLPKAWVTTWDKRVEDRLLSGDVIQIKAPSYRSERE